jgi:hypothetical protein
LAVGESQGPRFGSLRYLLYEMPHDELAACLASVRSAIGEEAFNTAWNDGKTIGRGQALATALVDPDGMPRLSTDQAV